MVSMDNGRGFYLNVQALKRVQESEVQICKGDRVKITADDNQHSGGCTLPHLWSPVIAYYHYGSEIFYMTTKRKLGV